MKSSQSVSHAAAPERGQDEGDRGAGGYRIEAELVDTTRTPRRMRAFTLEAQPQTLVVDAARSALIVVDMQNDFCSVEGWVASLGVDNSRLRDIYAPINAVAAAARAAAVPVVWLNWGVRPDRLNLSPGTRFPFNPDGTGPGLAGQVRSETRSYRLLAKGEWGAQIVEALGQDPGDVHVDKHRISGFWDTPLDAILRNLDVTTLFFTGVNADHCVLATLMDANFKGYDTIMVEDCVATTSPDFCLEACLHNVRFCFGFTTRSAPLVAGLVAA